MVLVAMVLTFGSWGGDDSLEEPDSSPLFQSHSSSELQSAEEEVLEESEDQEDQEDQKDQESQTPEPTKGVDVSGLERKQLQAVQAVASSYLPAWQQKTYEPSLSLDGDIETAWVEDATGLGLGQWLEHQFAQAEPVQEVQFYNGYGALYEKNGVLSLVAVSLSQGETFVYPVVGHWNTLVLPYAVESTSLRLTILEASSPNYQDTCISELLVFNKSDQAPTPQYQPQESKGFLGDLSALTPLQAQGFLAKIQASEQRALPSYATDKSTKVLFFDGGNGIPMMLLGEAFLEGDPEEDMSWAETVLWEWDGTQVVSHYVQAEDPADRWSTEYFANVLRKDGKLYLETDFASGGDVPPTSSIFLYALEGGRLSDLVAASLDVYSYTEEMADQSARQLLADARWTGLLPSNLKEQILASDTGYDSYHYRFEYGSFQGYQKLATLSQHGFGHEMSPEWMDSALAKAWLQSQL